MYHKNQVLHKFPPIVKGLLEYADKNHYGWHIPGHHFGRSAWKPWHDLLGQAIFDIDGAAELPGLDNLYDPKGIILEAERAAAEYFNVDEVRFLVNGSTIGNLAVILGCCKEGDKVFVPRNCHQSVMQGLVLSGARPVYLPVHWDSGLGLVGALQTEDLEKALSSESRGEGLVILLHPSWHGITGELQTQVETAHGYGMKVLVDEAHGPHFRAGSQFPITGIKAGADYSVSSAHKTLGAFGQASWLHFRDSHDPSVEAIKEALKLVETSSPSYILLASLDVARYQLQVNHKVWRDAALMGEELRTKINRIPGLWAPGKEFLEAKGVCGYDPTRLSVNVSGLGITGFEAKQWLFEKANTVLDVGDLQYLIYILDPKVTEKEEREILRGLESLSAAYSNTMRLKKVDKDCDLGLEFPIPKQEMTPRQAFFSKRRRVPLDESVGKIAGEPITPYPPGIPLVCPGEIIGMEVIESLSAWQAAGGIWPGQEDNTIAVIDGK